MEKRFTKPTNSHLFKFFGLLSISDHSQIPHFLDRSIDRYLCLLYFFLKTRHILHRFQGRDRPFSGTVRPGRPAGLAAVELDRSIEAAPGGSVEARHGTGTEPWACCLNCLMCDGASEVLLLRTPEEFF